LSRLDSRLITPPTEEEETRLYHHVWPDIILQMGLLSGIGVILFVLTRFIQIPVQFYQPINLGLVAAPVLIWFVVVWWRERLVPQPRRRLIPVIFVTVLAANAIAIPILDQVFQVQDWLSLESAINRIIGYTFTVGMVQELTKYLVLRLIIEPQHLRIRLDAAAYGFAAALGYATIVNLDFAINTNAAPSIMAFRVFDITSMNVAASLIVAYGLAEVRFNRQPQPLLLSATVALGALVTGVSIPIRAGLTNAGISVLATASLTSPLGGFLFSIVILVGVSVATAFLFNAAEREDREKVAEDKWD